jgi:protein-arginine kinase activator protein McsA
MKSLQESLDKAIADEEFELAADLRDRIRQVEAELAK